ncbi:MAG: hypothetical protein ACOX63_01015 [Christensenellales bacterium]|jgi:hypothetical protein
MRTKAKLLTQAQGIRLVLVSIVFDGSGGMLIKVLPWNPVVIAGFRSALASVLILFIIGTISRLLPIENHFWQEA